MNPLNGHTILSGDIITVIAPFLPLDDQFRSMRVCMDWFHSIQSMQIWWKQTLIDFLKIDQTLGMDEILAECDGEKQGEESIDWLKILKLQIAKLPKKIKTGTRGIGEDEFTMRNLTREHYGNSGLIKDWVSPFELDDLTTEYGEVKFPRSVSFYEFPFDLKSEIIEKYRDDDKLLREKLSRIYLTCLVYEFLTVGDYVPNMYKDMIRVIPVLDSLGELCLSNLAVEESIASVILCLLEVDDIEGIMKKWIRHDFLLKIKETDEIFEKANPKAIPSQVTAERVIECVRTDGLSMHTQLCPNIDMKESSWLSLYDIVTLKSNMEILGDYSALMKHFDNCAFPLYYNAGGGTYEFVAVTFNIEEDGRIVKLIREESRSYY